MNPWAALIGAGIGAGKAAFVDAPEAERQRRLAAETARYSPWTGMRPEPVKEADMFGSALQGASMGLGMGQSMDDAEGQNKLNKSQTDYYDALTKNVSGGDELAMRQNLPAQEVSFGSQITQPNQMQMQQMQGRGMGYNPWAIS